MKKAVKIAVPVVLALALVVILAGSLVVTQPNEYTIIKQFGAVVSIIDQPGLSLKTPFVQSASKMCIRDRSKIHLIFVPEKYASSTRPVVFLM